MGYQLSRVTFLLLGHQMLQRDLVLGWSLKLDHISLWRCGLMAVTEQNKILLE